MKQRLLRILSVLCVLALVCGCMTLSAFAEDTIKVISVQFEDENNFDGLRPISLDVSIGGTTITLSDENNWLAEASVASDAEWTVPDVAGYVHNNPGTAELAVVKYSHDVVRGSGTALINWYGDAGYEKMRPDYVWVNLLDEDNKVCSAPVKAVKVDGNQWTATFTNVPKLKHGTTDDASYHVGISSEVTGYTANVEGQNAISYTLKKGTLTLNTELNAPADTDIGGLLVKVSGPDGFSQTLTYAQLAAGPVVFDNVLAGAYVVEDENASSLIEGYVIDPANSKVADAVFVDGGAKETLNFKFTWKEEEAFKQDDDYDATANYGKLTFEIYGPNGLVATPTYGKDFEDGKYVLDNVIPGTYVVVERNAEGLVAWYNLQSDSVTGLAVYVDPAEKQTGSIASLKNIYKPAPTPAPDAEYIDIPVTKIWNDNGNRDGNRPGSITVNLLANDTPVDSHVLTADEGWQFTFTSRERYDADGNEIKYTISENPVAWYDGSINGYFVTNDYNPETTSASVYKVWDDNDNQRHLRPSSIAVTLLPTGTIYMLTAANDWSLTVDNLPTKRNGQDVTYSWKEEETVGYVLAGADVSGNNVTFYNHAVNVPKIPEWMPQAKVPGDMWFIFEEYDTALGGEILINHVGDCFD